MSKEKVARLTLHIYEMSEATISCISLHWRSWDKRSRRWSLSEKSEIDHHCIIERQKLSRFCRQMLGCVQLLVRFAVRPESPITELQRHTSASSFVITRCDSEKLVTEVGRCEFLEFGSVCDASVQGTRVGHEANKVILKRFQHYHRKENNTDENWW